MTTPTNPLTDGPRLPTDTTLLRFALAGSVDDGKSTLAGRLLYDSKCLLTDQLAAIGQPSGATGMDLALLTDGLRAEREQGITIDVAHRYFATPRRRFVMADTPGHVEYTRNTVTGASTADLMVILVDVRNGVVEQSRRHAAVAALMRIPHVVLAVNKMDLVDYGEPAFTAVAREFRALARGLGLPEPTAIPMSALRGDQVVTPSDRLAWYDGPTLLHHLESVPPTGEPAGAAARFPVQYVIRPRTAAHPDYRGFAGRIAAGTLRVGDRVTVLPSGSATTVTGIDALGVPVRQASSPQSVTLLLADSVDVARGDLIVAAGQAPPLTRTVEATVCHLHERPLRRGDRVLLKHTTRTVRALVADIPSRLGPSLLDEEPAPDRLAVNDIGRVVLSTAEPLALDAYRDSRRTGSFLLIDPGDGSTLAAGMAGPGPMSGTGAPSALTAPDDQEEEGQ
ncbi:GTP-binding protein [Streptomyces sp. NPDC002773]|uniref:sulfate adenylyltransferase subunit 1 n=1 Tax=Streptomyces sp. NPDC002773 TaxID=3154430 RepID=UPI00332F022F